MSTYRSTGNKHLHHDIRNYRDMAPESLSDEALLALVLKNEKNDPAIREALALLWNEEPATEWISTEKKKLKKTSSPPLPERGGGGRGRGRSAPPGRGEGGRGGRGGGRSSSVNTSGGRGRVDVAKPASPLPSTEAEVKVEALATENIQKHENTVQTVVQTTKPSPMTAAAPVWGGGMSLAQKLRVQELAASAPPPPPPPAPLSPEPPVELETVVEEVPTAQEEAPVSTSSAGQSKRSPRGSDAGRGRGRRRAYRDHPHARPDLENQNKEISSEANAEEEPVSQEFTKALQHVSLEKEQAVLSHSNDVALAPVVESTSHNPPGISDMVIMSPVRPSNAPVSDNIVGSPVLKMGRWGAPIEPTESSFQFGSFGNLGEAPAAVNDGDESPHKIASGLISSLTEPQSTWGQQPQLDQTDRESEAVSASLSVWGTQSQNDNSDENYGYDQQVSNPGNDNAPPGLGLGLGGLDTSAVVSQSNPNKASNNNRNPNRSAPGSQARKTDMDNNMSRQPQQYYPPVPGGFGMPYYGGFDMNLQPPSSGYGVAAQGSQSPAPGAPANPSQPVNAPNSSNQNGSNYNANVNNPNAPKYPGPPGMPAQMGAPYPPYYGNPYYQQAFYYGGAQPQNFYGRGQGMYPPRPYGGDPYAPQGMGGYDMYGQPAQFGDYGQMPMPPMHPQQGGNDRQSGKGNKNAGQNPQQSAVAVGGGPGTSAPGQPNQGDANQAVHSGYGYNYARPPDQGSGWAPYQVQAGWGGMMPFPAAPGGLGGGYSQMGGGAPSQPGNNRQGGGGSYNSYGRGGGGSSGNGAGDSSGGIGSAGAGTTSTW